MDRYVDEGIYPFLFARIEGDHGVIYEHSVVNKKILGDINVNADTLDEDMVYEQVSNYIYSHGPYRGRLT